MLETFAIIAIVASVVVVSLASVLMMRRGTNLRRATKFPFISGVAAPKGTFERFSAGSLLAGGAFFVLCLFVWLLAWRDIGILLFGIAMVFAGLANYLAFTVLHRMQSAGVQVGLWRGRNDFRLYGDYWRIAPERGWSRLPIIGLVVSFLLAACFLVSMMYSGSMFFSR